VSHHQFQLRSKRLVVSAVLLWTCSIPAMAADEQPARGGGRAFEAAQARNRDAETLKSLSAEGQILYQRDRVKLDGYRYCSQAVAQAERGELRESIRSASKAMHVGMAEGNDDLIAVSKRDLAIAYSYAGDLAHAEQYAREALTHRANDPRIVAGPAYKTLGDVAVRRDRFPEAIDWYNKASEAASDRFRPLVQLSLANSHVASGDAGRARSLYDQLPVPEAGLQPMYLRGLGNLLLIEGKPAEALKAFEAAASAAGGPDAGYHRLWAVEGVARSHLALGNRTAARDSYLEATRLSESIRARFRSEEFKTGLFGDLQEVFERAIALSMDTGDVEGAWQLSERSRARALLDIVRERVASVDGIEAAASAVALGDVTAVLRKDETLVQFHSLDDRLIVWTIGAGGLQGRSLPIPRVELDRAIEGVRKSIFERRRDTVDLSAALYAGLLSPLALAPGQRLIVVPHGGLHYLPFQALRAPEGYLIERNPIAIAPSASLAVQLARRRGETRGQLVAFGNPANSAREDLPGAEREVQRIAGLFADKRVYFQRDASKSRFREAAGSGRILHVAAHAEVDSVDPLHSRILLAADGNDPGFLEAREVYGVDLKGVSLVTLSACESGLGRIARGDEIQGFTRSFLTAGASGLVASLWPVADDSTELLMTTLYTELAGGAEAIDAMRKAQIAVLTQKPFAHPFFWAPFNLIGDWRLRAGT
jgi:CHAT domain-containing protein